MPRGALFRFDTKVRLDLKTNTISLEVAEVTVTEKFKVPRHCSILTLCHIAFSANIQQRNSRIEEKIVAVFGAFGLGLNYKLFGLIDIASCCTM